MTACPAPAVPALLQLRNVTRQYALPRERLGQPAAVVHAVAGVSLAVQVGRNLGVVGESGSGKSTLARLAMALEPPSSGEVRFLGRDLNRLSHAELRAARRDFQMVFQDPYGSLDPRQRVERIIAEPLLGASGQRERVAAALDAVGLRAGDADKYPHEFSGGQRQRIAIARALITRPKLIVADEPVSALDVSVQAQVLNLLQDLQDQFGVTYLLISHDLAVVDHVCDEVAVMYAGRVVEQGPPEVLFHAAAHPYTRALMAAAGATVVHRAAAQRSPRPARASIRVAPERPSTSACAFAPRCPHGQARCEAEAPALRVLAGGHQAACHFAEQVMTELPEPTTQGDR
jgi:peptide/nickel transport system ATP-binding protein